MMEAEASGAEGTREDELLYMLTEGSDLLLAGRVAEAKDAFKRALELEQDNEQALNLLGMSQFRLGEYKEATQIFEKLIDNNPVEPSLWLNLAMVHLKTERLAEAKRALETVLDLNPEHPRAASYMGLVLEREGNLEGAAPWYEKAGNMERAAQTRARAVSMPPSPALAHSADATDEPASSDNKSVEVTEKTAVAPSVGSEAAALTAANVQSLQRPSQPPSRNEAQAARAASLGFTFDDPEGGVEITVSHAAEPDDAPGSQALNADDFANRNSSAPRSDATRSDVVVSESFVNQASHPDPLQQNRQTGVSSTQAAPVKANQPVGDGASAPVRLTLPALIRSSPVPSPSGELQTVGHGAVALTINEILYLRTDRLLGLTGELEVEPINRRYRGRRTDSLFGGNDKPMSAAMGDGLALLDPEDDRITTLRLEGEDLYLMEEKLLAFTDGLVWENGRLPADEGDDLDIVHLRGSGDIVLLSQRAPVCLEVESERPVTVHAHRLIGWNGQVVPFRGPFPGLPESAERPPIVRFEGSGLVLCG